MKETRQLSKTYYNPRAAGDPKKGPVVKFACDNEPDVEYVIWAYDAGWESFTDGELEFEIKSERKYKGITQRSISGVRILVYPDKVAGMRRFFYRSRLHKLVKNNYIV